VCEERERTVREEEIVQRNTEREREIEIGRLWQR